MGEDVATDLEVVPARWRTALKWLSARPLHQLGTGLLLIGLLISAPFGGWADAAADGPARAASGQALDLGPVTVTLTEAHWTTEVSTLLKAQPGLTYVIVTGTARVSGSRPVIEDEYSIFTYLPSASRPLTGSLRVNGVSRMVLSKGTVGPAEDAQPLLISAPDGPALSALQPGIDYPVAWVFRHSGSGAALPSTLALDLYTQTWARAPITGVDEWRSPTVAYRVDLPLTEGRAS